MTELKQTDTRLTQRVELLAKAGAALAAALYVTGVAVVAFHLSRYGVESLDLLQARYFAAGFFALAAPFVTMGLATLVFDLHERKMSDRVTLFLAVGLGVLASAAFFFEGSLARLPVFIRSIVAVSVGVGTLVVVTSVMDIFLTRPPQGRWLILGALASVAGFLIAIYLRLFAQSIYPAIPAAMGGGRPRLVSLAPLPEDHDLWRARGIPINESGWTPPLELIVTTDHALVVLAPPRQPTFEIARERVRAVAVVPRDSVTPVAPN